MKCLRTSASTQIASTSPASRWAPSEYGSLQQTLRTGSPPPCPSRAEATQARPIGLADVPIWAVHGSDDQIIAVAQSQSMIAAINVAGGDPQFTEVPRLGHSSWDVVFRLDSKILDWMFQQRRGRR